jgi:hypothetical protein
VHKAEVQMVDPSRYEPKFFAAWETFADKIQRIFSKGEQDARTRPLAETQGRYAIAIWAMADLLYSIGQRDLAMHFHLLAEALHDLAEGKDTPLLKVEKKRGRKSDTNETWRLRASLCIGIQYLIASGMEQGKAITFVVRKYGTQLQGLPRLGSRPGSDLKSSIGTWLKTFASEQVRNDAAQWTYRKELQRLQEIKTSTDGTRLRQAGLKLIEKTALRAAQALKPSKPKSRR